MYLTRQADYMLRLLIHLAVQPDGTATIQEIADHFGISKNHLMKVAHRATRAGYVEGVRGRSGGLKLAKRPTAINIGQIISETESLSVVECFDEGSTECPIAASCGLKTILGEAVDAFLAVLDGYSLADIVQNKDVLVQLLSIESARSVQNAYSG